MDVNFSLENINEAAKTFLAAIGQKKVIALHGQMGVGKTTFVHAICDSLGVNGAVSSPTFSIINEYKSANGDIIYHLDLYRLKDEQEAINAGVEDCLYSGNLRLHLSYFLKIRCIVICLFQERENGSWLLSN
jgi:tRNA threonylcarbamoyladenosine biosynthesis protein TsaE